MIYKIKNLLSQLMIALFVVSATVMTVIVTDVAFGNSAVALAESNDEHDEDEDKNEEELEIWAEPYEDIDGKWEVEAEVNGEESRFYVYNIDDEDELVSEITEKVNQKFDTDFSEEEVSDVLEMDEEEHDEDDEEWEEDEGEEKYMDLSFDPSNATEQERQEFIQELQMMIIALIMQLMTQLEEQK